MWVTWGEGVRRGRKAHLPASQFSLGLRQDSLPVIMSAEIQAGRTPHFRGRGTTTGIWCHWARSRGGPSGIPQPCLTEQTLDLLWTALGRPTSGRRGWRVGWDAWQWGQGLSCVGKAGLLCLPPSLTDTPSSSHLHYCSLSEGSVCLPQIPVAPSTPPGLQTRPLPIPQCLSEPQLDPCSPHPCAATLRLSGGFPGILCSPWTRPHLFF